MSSPPQSSPAPSPLPVSAAAMPAASAPPPPSPPRGLSGAARAVIAIVVVVVLLLAVFALGLVPGVSLFGSKSGPSGTSSAQSIGAANSTAGKYDAGSLVYLVGVSTTYSFSFGKIPSSVTTCSVKDGLPNNITVPAESGSYSSGDASVWIFVYINATTPSESIVAVVGSTPYFLGQVTGSSCVNATSVATITGTFVSSTQAAAAVDGDAGSFFSAHSSANALYLLVENNTTKEPDWAIVYTNCSYNPATNTTSGGKKGDLFLGLVNGKTNDVITSLFEPGALNCSAGFNLGGSTPVVIDMTEVAALGGGSTYIVELSLAVSSSANTSEFGLKLTTAASVAVPVASAVSGAGCTVGATYTAGTTCKGVSGDWYAVLTSVTGAILAIYTATGWSGSVAVSSADSLSVVTATSVIGIGDTLSVWATGSTSVSGSVTL